MCKRDFKPFFSVIIPTYNRAEMIARSIESVLKQTFNNYELIVVDDGSTDATEDICGKYNLIYLRGNNNGVSAARNSGVVNARGEWLAFLDSDDEWHPEKLRKQYDFIQNNRSIQLVHGNEKWIKDGKFLNQHLKHKKSGGDIFNASLKLCLISPSAVVIRKTLFLQLGGFREDYPVCEDYDLWLKITAFNKVGFIEDILVSKYGGHEDQLSRKYKGMDYWRIMSIDWILNNYDLPMEKYKAAIKELAIKSEILLNGYKKHKKMEKYEKIDHIRKLHVRDETI